MREFPERLGPCLGTLSPKGISLIGDRVVFNNLETLEIANPLIDLGELLAEVAISGLAEQEAASIRDRLMETYLAASKGVSAAEIEVFEVLALLRRTRVQAVKSAPLVGPEQSINAAEIRMQGLR